MHQRITNEAQKNDKPDAFFLNFLDNDQDICEEICRTKKKVVLIKKVLGLGVH